MAERFHLQLVERRPLSDNTEHLVFQRTDGQPLHYQPGQFIQLHFPCGDGMARRSYSIASLPEGDNPYHCRQIEIAVSWVEGGLATTCLQAMQAGDRLEGSGPLGRFCLPDEEPEPVQRYVLVGTGTGITPYRAMWPEIRRRMESGIRFAILMGARRPQDLLYETDFRRMEAESGGLLHYHACLSREQRTPPAPGDVTGHVQQAFELLQPDGSTDVFYLCGNPAMVDEATETLRTLGFSSARIRREKYLSPKR